MRISRGLTTAAVVSLPAAILLLASEASRVPLAGRVVPTGSMVLGRSGHTATALPNGKVLVAGGMVCNGEFLADCELYDPATGKFSSAGKMSSRRVSHAATLLPNGKVLIAGGIESRYQSEGHWRGRVVAGAELYDPETGTFTPTGSMTVARSSHAAVLLRNAQVLILGGEGGGGWRELLASAELYDPGAGIFRPVGDLRTPRIPHAVAVLNNGDVLIAGGTGPNRTVLASAEIYQPSTGKFTAAGRLMVARHKHALAMLPDGRVLIIGGSDERDWDGQLSVAELYDPSKSVSAEIGKMTAARFKIGQAVVRLANGQILVAGGAEHAEVYDPAQDSFRAVAGSLEVPWHFSTATLLSDGRVLIVGGYGNNSEGTARAWVYQP